MARKNSISVCLTLLTVCVMLLSVPIPFTATSIQSAETETSQNYSQLIGDELVIGEHTFAIHGDLDDRALYLDGEQVAINGIVPWWVSGIETGDSIQLVIGDAAVRTYLSHYVVSDDGGETWNIVESFEGYLKPHIASADGTVYVMFERSLDLDGISYFKEINGDFERIKEVPSLSYADILDYRMTEEYLAYDAARKAEMTDTPAESLPSDSGRAPAREWCYIYFCNGEASGIEAYLEADANEMAAGGSSANHWSVCLFDDDGAGTNQVRIMNDGGGGYISYTMAQVGLPSEPDLNSPTTFITFLNWCFANYPGNKVVWDNGGHGGGCDGAMYDETPSSGVIDLVEITTIADSLMTTLGRPIDVTAWDLCLMMTQEWLYGYKPITPFSVASMNTIVGDGFNYEVLMDYLAANNPTPIAMAHQIALSYWTEESAYISVVDMNNWDYNMWPTQNNLWQELRHGSYTSQISSAFSSAWYPYSSGYCHDVRGWMNNMNSAIANPTIQTLTAQVRDMIWTANYPSGPNDVIVSKFGSSASHYGLGDEMTPNTAWKIDIETIRNEAFSQSGISNTIPTCTITSPSEGADVPMGGTVTIQGTAADSVGVTRVEVKINREWWAVATGTNSWSFNWDVASDAAYYGLGAYKIFARSYDGTDYSNYQCINVNVIESYGSAGAVMLDKTTYLLEDTVHVTVTDGDLTVPSITVNVKSTIEPTGETVTLLATTPQGKYEGSITASATNSAGVLWVAHGNTITATYNDADSGGGSPAVVTDTATVDGQVAPATGLSVEWWGVTFVTLIDEHFLTNPAGWTITNTAGTAWTWSSANQRMENTYGYPNSGYLDSPVVDCTGLTGTTLSFWHFWQANYAGGTQDGYVRGSIDGGSTWPHLVDEFHHNDPATETAVKNYTIPWADGHSLVRIRYDIYNYDDWYWRIDDVLMTAGGGSTTEHNWLNWTLSTDDGVGANDVDHYNIYRAVAASGPWNSGALIGTVAAGIATYTDPGRGEVDGINWWYVVRAQDIWGNLEMNTNAIPEVGTGLTPYDIDLTGRPANSWVFVSFPHAVSGNIQDMLNDAVNGDGLTTWTVAKWYNPQTPLDPWKTYRTGSTVNDLTTISNAMGVWLWITANGGDQYLTVGVTGDYSAAAVNINLYTGWNIVGYPTATSRTESATLPAAADFVAVWQAATPYITQHAKGASMMSNGHAYWVHVTADCVWTVNV